MDSTKRLFAVVFLPWGFAMVLGGCAHAPLTREVDAKTLLAETCGDLAPGAGVRSVKGSVWLKAESKEARGQFPAMLEAQEPSRLHMEVTNLLGGTEAVIDVRGSKYTIEVPGSKKSAPSRQQGDNTWGGIPLAWANQIFLGKIPCPSPKALADAEITAAGGELRLRTVRSLEREEEVFVYRYREWGGRAWPEKLHWERKGSLPMTVDFQFDDPEDGTRSPRKWEAKSEQGEVKVRWRDRDVTR